MARAQVCVGCQLLVACGVGCRYILLAAVVIPLSRVLLTGWHRQGGAAEGSRILR